MKVYINNFQTKLRDRWLRYYREIAIRWMSLDLTDNKSTLILVMAWCRQATSHYLNQCWPRSMSPYGITRPRWVNSLWPSLASRHYDIDLDKHWIKKMACCLLAPTHYTQSHYLDQYCLIIKGRFISSQNKVKDAHIYQVTPKNKSWG